MLARALVLIALATPAHADLDPFIAPLPPLDGDLRAVGVDVSGDGSRVLGTSFDATEMPTIVLWDGLGPATAIAGTAGTAFATALSGDGATVVGTVESTYSFTWTEAGGLSALDDPLSGWSPLFASAVSFDGSVIVGEVHPPIGGFDPDSRAALWADGVLSLFAPSGHENGLYGSLIDTSSVGRVAGREDIPRTASRWFVGEAASIEPIGGPPGVFSPCRLEAISDDGSTWVGDCWSPQPPVGRWPVRWSDRGGEQTSFLTLLHYGIATDVSGDGSVVVGSVTDGPASRPFVWTQTDGFALLEDRLQGAGVDTSSIPLDAIENVRVSTDGRTVVGESFVARIPAPAPEPRATLTSVASLVALARVSARRSSR